YDARIIRRLWSFTKPHKALLIASLISYPVASVFQMGQPYMVKIAIDQHLVPKKLEGFGFLILAYIGLVVLEFFTRFLQTMLTQLLGQRVTKDMRVTLFRKLQTV